jgi:hypothetical protein
LQVPVPLVIVTSAVFWLLAGTEQEPVAVMAAGFSLCGRRCLPGPLLSFVVAVTVNVPLYGSLVGAPVKVTVGVANCAVVVWLAVAAA